MRLKFLQNTSGSTRSRHLTALRIGVGEHEDEAAVDSRRRSLQFGDFPVPRLAHVARGRGEPLAHALDVLNGVLRLLAIRRAVNLQPVLHIGECVASVARARRPLLGVVPPGKVLRHAGPQNARRPVDGARPMGSNYLHNAAGRRSPRVVLAPGSAAGVAGG